MKGEKYFFFKYLLVINTLNIALYLFLSPLIAIRASYLLIGLLALFTVFISKVNIFSAKTPSNLILLFLIWIVVDGTVVGLLSLPENPNFTVKKQIEYTLIGFGNLLLFLVVFHLIRIQSVTYIKKAALLIMASELVYGIIRVFSVGLEFRTGLGYSYILPVIYSISVSFNNIKKTLPNILIFLSITLNLLSGMRSVIIITIFQIFSISFKGMTNISTLIKIIKSIFIFSIFLTFIGLLFPEILVKSTYFLDLVTDRISNTFLSDDGFRLDEGGAREEESYLALEQTNIGDNVFNTLFGYGNSFTYTNPEGEVTGHIHLTAYAMLIKHGSIGLSLYILLFISQGFILIKSYYKKNIFLFSVDVCILSVFLVSIFSGILTNPIVWVVLGYCYGVKKNQAVN